MGETYIHPDLRTLNMEELFAYFKKRRKGFAAAIRGATEVEIEEFEQLAKHPLPEDYKVFLRHVGHADAGMFGGSDRVWTSPADYSTYDLKYDFSIGAITKAYRKWKWKKLRRAEIDTTDPELILIGLQRHSQDQGAYYLDCRERQTTGLVINVDAFGDLHKIVAPSLKDFVLDHSFRFDERTF